VLPAHPDSVETPLTCAQHQQHRLAGFRAGATPVSDIWS